MRLSLSLADADRERLGAPEWIEFETEDVDIDECIVIQDVLGFDFVDFLDKFPRHPAALKAGVWIGLRRAGVEHDLKTLTFKPYQSKWARPADGDLEGKDPSTPPPDTPPS